MIILSIGSTPAGGEATAPPEEDEGTMVQWWP